MDGETETGRPSPKQAKGRDQARNPGLIALTHVLCGCVAVTETAVGTFLPGPWTPLHLLRESGESMGGLRYVSDGRGRVPRGYGGH